MSFDILVVLAEIGRIASTRKCVNVCVCECVSEWEREGEEESVDEKIKKKVKCSENFFSCQSSCLNYMTWTKRG